MATHTGRTHSETSSNYLCTNDGLETGGLSSGGCGDSRAEREFPSDKVYRGDDRRIAGVEAVGLQCLAFVVVHNTLDVLPPRTVPAGSILGAGLVIARLSDL